MNLRVPIIVSCFIVALSSAHAQNPRPSEQVDNPGEDWGKPVYLYSFEEMVRRLEDPFRREWQKPQAVIAALGDIEGKTVYDLGAGTGYFSMMIAKKGAKVIAADPDRRFLAYALAKRNIAGFSPGRFDVRPIPYDDPLMTDNETDVVLTVNTWHMVGDRPAYLKKLHAGLKTDGRFVVVNHQKRKTPHGPAPERRMSIAQTTGELKQAGFEILRVDNAFSEINYLVVARKMSPRNHN